MINYRLIFILTLLTARSLWAKDETVVISYYNKPDIFLSQISFFRDENSVIADQDNTIITTQNIPNFNGIWVQRNSGELNSAQHTEFINIDQIENIRPILNAPLRKNAIVIELMTIFRTEKVWLLSPLILEGRNADNQLIQIALDDINLKTVSFNTP